MSNKKFYTVLVVVLVAVSAAVIPWDELEAFADYTPPIRLDVTRFDYMKEDQSPSATPTQWPTLQLEYPHRAFFVGGAPTRNSGSQQHDVNVYIVMSKTPVLDCFTFTYRPGTKQNYQTGYIRANFADGWDVMGLGKDFVILNVSATGMPSGPLAVPLKGLPTYPGSLGYKYFDFDFWYICCGDLNIPGLSSIEDVPYGYIRRCGEQEGSGATSSESGGSSGGSGSGGSPGDSSGGSGSSGGSTGGIKRRFLRRQLRRLLQAAVGGKRGLLSLG